MGKCPVCESESLEGFLHRSGVPVHQNLIFDSEAEACSCARGELEMIVCAACGFVFNRAFDAAKLAYGAHYDNTQSYSPAFDDYLDSLIETLVQQKGVKNKTIVEVGCGKGVFLRKLVAYPSGGNRGFGFDPSYVGPLLELDGRLQFRQSFYDQSCDNIAADFVVSRHVIEHVSDPLALLRQIHGAIGHNGAAMVFFETPCVDWILRNRVFWDFFYEHCSLFSRHSLALAFERSGFFVTSVSHLFGGQYLWMEAGSRRRQPGSYDAGNETLALARQFAAAEAEIRHNWIARLDELRQHAAIAFWGAGAKGATLANLVDPARTRVDCLVDINPNKQGKFIPGTGHPIVSPQALGERGIDTIILMNPNYRREVETILRANGLAVDLIDGWAA